VLPAVDDGPYYSIRARSAALLQKGLLSFHFVKSKEGGTALRWKTASFTFEVL
jgi:hypothetical protein